MELKIQKRLAAKVLKSAESNVRIDPSRLEEVKDAITKTDIRSLIKDKAITLKNIRVTSKFRIRKNKFQKSKGRRKGSGSIKSSVNARNPRKRSWINGIRLQRGLLKGLRDKKIIERSSYRLLYRRAKGGFFRSKRHLKMYLEENKLIKK